MNYKIKYDKKIDFDLPTEIDKSFGLFRATSAAPKVFGVNPLYFAINQQKEQKNWKKESLKDINNTILDEIVEEIKQITAENDEILEQTITNAINKDENNDYDNPEFPINISKTGFNKEQILYNYKFTNNILNITVKMFGSKDIAQESERLFSIEIASEKFKKMVLNSIKSKKNFMNKILKLKDGENCVLENICKYRPFTPVVSAERTGKTITINFNKANFKVDFEIFLKK